MGGAHDGLLRVPPTIKGPLPLIIMLRGYGRGAEKALRRIIQFADAALVVLPESLGAAWDVLEGGYGPDMLRLDAMMARLLEAWPVNPARLAIAGFSDGASYALSVAMMNGALFSHALAFSPGFAHRSRSRVNLATSSATGRGTILSGDHDSRWLLSKLRFAGCKGL